MAENIFRPLDSFQADVNGIAIFGVLHYPVEGISIFCPDLHIDFWFEEFG
jgi:hypothetical protein